MPRDLAVIDADIAAVRSALSAGRVASVYAINGRTRTIPYADLRRELQALLSERIEAENMADGTPTIAFIPTMKGW